ncbi:MAG: hypothetical protein KAT78_07400 [Flavobacteriaceae bacterium]|nr:hypothetical protein [Flavobacteriaceae bacterium]
MSNTSTPLDMTCDTFSTRNRVEDIVYRILKLLILISTSTVLRPHIYWDNNLKK